MFEFSPLACVLGVLLGLAGFIPFVIARRRKKLVVKLGITWGIICFFISFALCLAGFFVCRFVAPAYMLCFGLSTVAAFMVVTGVFAVWCIINMRHDA